MDERGEPRARRRQEQKTGLSWVRLGQRQSMSKRREEKRARGGRKAGEEGSQ